MESQEKKIIEKCQKGDKESFAYLYDFYIVKIYSFLFYKVFDKSVAEDLTSQVFIKVLKNIGKFNIKQGYFSSWLYKIARNTFIDYQRSYKPNYNIDDFWNISTSDDFSNQIGAAQELDKIKELLKKFKPVQREIIILKLWDELSYLEISEILGLSEANCRMIFSRSIKELRAEMVQLSLLIIISKQILCLIK